MGNAAHRMQVLINDLLQLSQITAKGKPFKKVDLAVISREVIGDLEVIGDISGSATATGSFGHGYFSGNTAFYFLE